MTNPTTALLSETDGKSAAVNHLKDDPRTRNAQAAHWHRPGQGSRGFRIHSIRKSRGGRWQRRVLPKVEFIHCVNIQTHKTSRVNGEIVRSIILRVIENLMYLL